MVLANDREERIRSSIRENKIDKSLSDLVVYCRTVPFELDSKYNCVLRKDDVAQVNLVMLCIPLLNMIFFLAFFFRGW